MEFFELKPTLYFVIVWINYSKRKVYDDIWYGNTIIDVEDIWLILLECMYVYTDSRFTMTDTRKEL